MGVIVYGLLEDFTGGGFVGLLPSGFWLASLACFVDFCNSQGVHFRYFGLLAFLRGAGAFGLWLGGFGLWLGGCFGLGCGSAFLACTRAVGFHRAGG